MQVVTWNEFRFSSSSKSAYFDIDNINSIENLFFLLDDVLFQVMTPFFIIQYLFIHKIVWTLVKGTYAIIRNEYDKQAHA